MPRHVIVDGSNLATEGRTKPSLSQLVDAVQSFMADYPDDLISVIVDATFGHRIDQREVADFDSAVENNELVTPPAGAVGRGDAFIIAVAKKVNGVILSNDSYQEFHGDHGWLFDRGRLIGGKPVPHVGWVWVERTPVRGPLSRRSVKEAKSQRPGDADVGQPAAPRDRPEKRRRRGAGETVTAEAVSANQPMPVPSAPPPGPARGARRSSSAGEDNRDREESPDARISGVGSGGEPAKREPVNAALAFIEFVSRHPKGSVVSGTVEHYSSHGAYVRFGDVLGYAPLRLMGDPAPRSARDLLKLGEVVAMEVADFHPARRSIDLRPTTAGSTVVPEPAPAEPLSADGGVVGDPVASPAQPVRRGRRRSVDAAAAAPEEAAAAALSDAAPSQDAVQGDPSLPSSERERAESIEPATPKRGRRSRVLTGTDAESAAGEIAASVSAMPAADGGPVGETAPVGSGVDTPALRGGRGRRGAATSSPTSQPVAPAGTAEPTTAVVELPVTANSERPRRTRPAASPVVDGSSEEPKASEKPSTRRTTRQAATTAAPKAPRQPRRRQDVSAPVEAVSERARARRAPKNRDVAVVVAAVEPVQNSVPDTASAAPAAESVPAPKRTRRKQVDG